MKNNNDKERYRINETGVYIYGQRAAIIDGEAEIFGYSEENVVFRLKKNKYLTVGGRGLTVRVAGKNVSEVSGHIDFVKYGDNNA